MKNFDEFVMHMDHVNGARTRVIRAIDDVAFPNVHDPRRHGVLAAVWAYAEYCYEAGKLEAATVDVSE